MTGLSGEATAHSPPCLRVHGVPCPTLLARTRRASPPRSAAGSAHPPSCPLSHREPGPAATSAAAPFPQRSAGMPRRPPPPSHRGPPPHSRRRPSSVPPLQPATRTGVPHPPTIPIRRSASHRAQRHSIRRAVPSGARNTNYFSHLQENGTRGRKRSRTAAGKKLRSRAEQPVPAYRSPVEATTKPFRRARQVGATAGAGPGRAARAWPVEARRASDEVTRRCHRGLRPHARAARRRCATCPGRVR